MNTKAHSKHAETEERRTPHPTFSRRGVHTERKQPCKSGAGSRVQRFSVRWHRDPASSHLMDPIETPG
ncbi:unnamed protein product [Sphagnum balticum]